MKDKLNLNSMVIEMEYYDYVFVSSFSKLKKKLFFIMYVS